MIEIEQALYQRLTGDATLGALLATTTSVFNTIVPEGSVAPYVVFSVQSDVDQPTLGRASAWIDTRYQVKAVTHNTASDTGSVSAETIRSRIDLLLNDYTLVVTGFSTMVCRRVSRLKYPELFDGLTVWHAGSTYQIGVSS